MRREGWLRVSSSRGVRRLFVVSDGFVVKCFAVPPSAARQLTVGEPASEWWPKEFG